MYSDDLSVIDQVKELSEIMEWECTSLYHVGQLAYILRAQGDFDLADSLDNWREDMEHKIHAEFSYPQETNA